MRAMIFAAGLGTRLRPLTNDRPKALVQVKGVPLLEIAIRKLISFGFNQLIINVHHFADQIRHFVFENNSFGAEITFSDETDQLLNTGGGLKKASWFFEDEAPFLVYNVDVLTDLNLNDLVIYHQSQNALATLAVRNRIGTRYLLFDPKHQLVGWKHPKTEEIKMVQPATATYNQLAFSGIQVIDPRLFELTEEQGAFSIIDLYLRLGKSEKIVAYPHDQGFWMDLGKLPQLTQVEKAYDLEQLLGLKK
ncbi:MAG: nucleotidyltransferase family protein [Candidatus Cyclobacteriaceae bacterium M3_2C_046]